jgi:hypothetical protein
MKKIIIGLFLINFLLLSCLLTPDVVDFLLQGKLVKCRERQRQE